MKFQNVVELSKYIIEIYSRSGSLIQYRIRQVLIKVDEISNDEKRKVVVAHKSEYQNAKILENHNLRKKEKRAIFNNHETPSKKRKLSFANCLKSFQSKIEQGSCYICVVCNCTMYRKSVKLFKNGENDLTKSISTNIVSFDNNKYICLTCSKKTNKNKIPCQAVCNKLEVADIPQELKSLNKLEITLISHRLLFKKIAIMAKVQMPKIKGSICNIAIHVQDICNSLPRNFQSSGLVLVKLKKKLARVMYILNQCVHKKF